MEIDDDIYEESGSSMSENQALNSNRGKVFITSQEGRVVDQIDLKDQDIRSDSNIGSSDYQSTPLNSDKNLENNQFRMSIIKDEPSKEQSGGNPSISVVSNEEIVGAVSLKSSDIIQRDQQTFQVIEERM